MYALTLIYAFFFNYLLASFAILPFLMIMDSASNLPATSNVYLIPKDMACTAIALWLTAYKKNFVIKTEYIKDHPFVIMGMILGLPFIIGIYLISFNA